MDVVKKKKEGKKNENLKNKNKDIGDGIFKGIEWRVLIL